jgi:hypothetical protein
MFIKSLSAPIRETLPLQDLPVSAIPKCYGASIPHSYWLWRSRDPLDRDDFLAVELS